jgi:hypothetical protein
MINMRVWMVAAMSAALALSALAAEPMIGSWAAKPEFCGRSGDRAANSGLSVSSTSLSWFDGHCRIGKMYKAGQAVYLQVHCFGKGDVPVTLNAYGDRMRVTWGGAKVEELRRCN